MSNNKNGGDGTEEFSENPKNSSESRQKTPLALIKGRRGTSFSKSGRYRLDNLERLIIDQLRTDGRKPFQAIARELSVDEKTVRNRVNKLRELGVLNIIPTTNENRMKGCIVAIVGINIDTDARKDVEGVANEISALPMVSWVGVTMGQYDMVAEVVLSNWDELARFEYSELPFIPGVAKTDSFLVLSHFGKRGVPYVESVLQPVE